MAVSGSSFEERISRIEGQRSSQLKHGYVHEIRADGLIVARARKVRPVFPFRSLLLLITGYLLLKFLVIIGIDKTDYDQRLNKLEKGTGPERVAAFLMQPDPISDFFGGYVAAKLQ